VNNTDNSGTTVMLKMLRCDQFGYAFLSGKVKTYLCMLQSSNV